MNKKLRKKIIDIYPPSTKKNKVKKKIVAEGEVLIKKIKKEEVSGQVYQEVGGAFISGEESSVSDRETHISGVVGATQISPEVTEEYSDRKQIKKIFSWRKYLSWIGVLLLAGGFYYLGFVVLVRADVNIKTLKTSIPLQNEIVIDSNVSQLDISKGIIPGTKFVFQKELSKTFKSSGRGKDERKAKGVVTLYNAYSTYPQILVATTRLETPDHKIYRLDSRVVIPGARIKNGKIVPSKIDVAVTADKPGPEYNIGPCELPDCKFTIVGFKGTKKYQKFYGTSAKPMSGGASASMPMVTAEDVREGENEVLNEMMKEINEEIQKKIPPELTILEEGKSGLRLSQITKDAEVGDFRESFNIKAQGEMIIIAFKQDDLWHYIQAKLKDQLKDNQEFYQEPEVQIKILQSNFQQGTLKAKITAKQLIRTKLSVAEIKKKIAGKPVRELNKVLEKLPGIETIHCSLRPFWVKKLPGDIKKIRVSID